MGGDKGQGEKESWTGKWVPLESMVVRGVRKPQPRGCGGDVFQGGGTPGNAAAGGSTGPLSPLGPGEAGHCSTSQRDFVSAHASLPGGPPVLPGDPWSWSSTSCSLLGPCLSCTPCLPSLSVPLSLCLQATRNVRLPQSSEALARVGTGGRCRPALDSSVPPTPLPLASSSFFRSQLRHRLLREALGTLHPPPCSPHEVLCPGSPALQPLPPTSPHKTRGSLQSRDTGNGPPGP